MKATIKKKLLTLLGSGLALTLARSPKQYLKIIKSTHRYFREIKREELTRLLGEFRSERLIHYHENNDDTVTIVLSENGKKKALKYKLNELSIKTPIKWDKKWRMVIFDIPEKNKIGREVLRRKLKELGFYQLQKSIFIHPHECENEINFITEIFELRPYVYFLEVNKITNESALRLNFELY